MDLNRKYGNKTIMEGNWFMEISNYVYGISRNKNQIKIIIYLIRYLNIFKFLILIK
jgi:hypothetical protein